MKQKLKKDYYDYFISDANEPADKPTKNADDFLFI